MVAWLAVAAPQQDLKTPTPVHAPPGFNPLERMAWGEQLNGASMPPLHTVQSLPLALQNKSRPVVGRTSLLPHRELRSTQCRRWPESFKEHSSVKHLHYLRRRQIVAPPQAGHDPFRSGI